MVFALAIILVFLVPAVWTGSALFLSQRSHLVRSMIACKVTGFALLVIIPLLFFTASIRPFTRPLLISTDQLSAPNEEDPGNKEETDEQNDNP